MKLIPLTAGMWTVIDDEDFDRVNQFRWFASSCGPDRWYAKNSDVGYLHRWLMGDPDGLVIDHIDGLTLNNTRANLRLCTQAENLQNTAKTTSRPTTSRHKGVSFLKSRNRWQCRLVKDGKVHNRYCETEEEAARAYNELARQHFGEYAKLNNVEESSEVERVQPPSQEEDKGPRGLHGGEGAAEKSPE